MGEELIFSIEILQPELILFKHYDIRLDLIATCVDIFLNWDLVGNLEQPLRLDKCENP